jgi:hypothetical protein
MLIKQQQLQYELYDTDCIDLAIVQCGFTLHCVMWLLKTSSSQYLHGTTYIYDEYTVSNIGLYNHTHS